MPFIRSYSPDYFSLEDIMVTQERVRCKTLVTLRRLGFLNTGCDKEDIDKDATIDLPFWLAHKLTNPTRIVSLDIPKIYKERTRDIFEADAKIINLFRVNPHFYEFGCYLSNINHRESNLIQNIIIQSFKERFRILMDWADNIMTEPNKIQQLDISERNLLKVGHKARMQLDAWLVEGKSQMKAAEMVVNLKKRKLVALESE